MGGGKSKPVLTTVQPFNAADADDLAEDQAREAAAGGGGGGSGGGSGGGNGNGIAFDSRAANFGNATGLANPNVGTEGLGLTDTIMQGGTKVSESEVGQAALNGTSSLTKEAIVLGDQALAGAVNSSGTVMEGINGVVNSDEAAQLAEGATVLGEALDGVMTSEGMSKVGDQVLTGAANAGGAVAEGMSKVGDQALAGAATAGETVGEGVAEGMSKMGETGVVARLHDLGEAAATHLHELGEAAAHVGEEFLHGGMELGGEIVHGGIELAHATGDVVVPVLIKGGEIIGAVGSAVGSLL